jgi:hypothetical protein
MADNVINVVVRALGSLVAGSAILGLVTAALWSFAYPHLGSAGASLAMAGVIALLWGAFFLFTRSRAVRKITVAAVSRPVFIAAMQLLLGNSGRTVLEALAAGMAAGAASRAVAPARPAGK